MLMQLLRSKKAKVIPRLLIGGKHTAMRLWCERFRVVETIAGAEGCERRGITPDSCCSTITKDQDP
jgi:hypothetical protein